MSHTRRLIDEAFARQFPDLYNKRLMPEPFDVPETKWKIQTGAPGGWADIKVSTDEDGVYTDDFYDSAREAQEEIDSMFAPPGGIDGSPDDFRVVPADTPADYDLY